MLTYSAGMIGVAVYGDCLCDHSRQIVWLADDDCCSCCDHDEDKSNDTGCSVTYKMLQIDQAVNATLLCCNHCAATDYLFAPTMLSIAPALASAARYNHDPPPLNLPSPDIYRLSQLRL